MIVVRFKLCHLHLDFSGFLKEVVKGLRPKLGRFTRIWKLIAEKSQSGPPTIFHNDTTSILVTHMKCNYEHFSLEESIMKYEAFTKIVKR